MKQQIDMGVLTQTGFNGVVEWGTESSAITNQGDALGYRASLSP